MSIGDNDKNDLDKQQNPALG